VERLQPVLCALRMRRQPEVEADDGGLLARYRRERLGAALGEEEREVVAQRRLELRADRFLVLDDEELGLHLTPRGAPRLGASSSRVTQESRRRVNSIHFAR